MIPHPGEGRPARTCGLRRGWPASGSGPGQLERLRLLLAMPGQARGADRQEFKRYGGEVMTETRTNANAVITVHKYEPVAYDEPAEGPVLTRIHVEESFSGDIAGDGVVEFLQAA